MLPDTLAPADLQCPAGGCQAGPGDAREPRAVFLGSPTGWRKGKRKAVLLAGMRNPEQACHPPIAAPTAFKMLIIILVHITSQTLSRSHGRKTTALLAGTIHSELSWQWTVMGE